MAFVEHEASEQSRVGAEIARALLGGIALRMVSARGASVTDRKQVALTEVKRHVDAVAGTQGEHTHHPCRDGYSTIAAERDVGAACTFQKFNHVCKDRGFEDERYFKFRMLPLYDDELNVKVELPAKPCYLWVPVGRLRIGEVYATPLGVALNTSPTEFVQQIGAAFGMTHGAI